MKPIRELMLAASLLVFSQTGMAAFVAHDLNTSGDGLLTLDEATNLEWLDVTASVQRSYSDIATQLSAGGNFAGFRYATLGEMETLFLHAGITPGDGAFADIGQVAQVQQFVSLFGRTWFEVDGFPGPGVRGIYGQADGSEAHFMADTGINTSANTTAAVIGGQCVFECASFSDTLTNPAIGSFLVRNTASVVPLPMSGWFLLTGLVALSRSTKKRQPSV